MISDTEQGCSAFHDEIGDIVKDALGSLTSEGSLSIEEGQQLSQDYSEQNITVVKKFTGIKKKQLKQLNERMIEKKKRKLIQLRERQEAERSKVILDRTCFVWRIHFSWIGDLTMKTTNYYWTL